MPNRTMASRCLRLAAPAAFSVVSIFVVGCADALSRSAEVGVYLASGGSDADGAAATGPAGISRSGGGTSGAGGATSTGGAGAAEKGTGGATHTTQAPATTSSKPSGSPPPSTDGGAPSQTTPPSDGGSTTGFPPIPGCSSGSYTGTIACGPGVPGVASTLPTVPVPAPVSGTVTFTLEASPISPFTLVTNDASATATGTGFSFSSLFAGEFDCLTGSFHATANAPGAPVPPLTSTPQIGNFDGQIEPATHALDGAFWITDGTTPCVGTWSATPTL